MRCGRIAVGSAVDGHVLASNPPSRTELFIGSAIPIFSVMTATEPQRTVCQYCTYVANVAGRGPKFIHPSAALPSPRLTPSQVDTFGAKTHGLPRTPRETPARDDDRGSRARGVHLLTDGVVWRETAETASFENGPGGPMRFAGCRPPYPVPVLPTLLTM